MPNPIALITGASAGIGTELAREFARQGHDLVITARRQSRLEALRDELGKHVDVQIVSADLATAKGVRELLKYVDESGTEVDVLVNNAGLATQGRFQDTTKSVVSDIVDVNVGALAQLTHALLPQMLERGRGRILNIASIVGFRAVPGMSLYSASKAFVLNFTEALAEELVGTGVSVTASCPGLTKTEMAVELQAGRVPEVLMASPQEVAKEAFRACMRGDVIHVPGPLNQALVTVMEAQPRWLTRMMSGMAARVGFAATS